MALGLSPSIGDMELMIASIRSGTGKVDAEKADPVAADTEQADTENAAPDRNSTGRHRTSRLDGCRHQEDRGSTSWPRQSRHS